MKIRPNQTKLIQDNRAIINQKTEEILKLVTNLIITEAMYRGLSRYSKLTDCSQGSSDLFVRICMRDSHGTTATIDLPDAEFHLCGLAGLWNLPAMIRAEWYPEEEEVEVQEKVIETTDLSA